MSRVPCLHTHLLRLGDVRLLCHMLLLLTLSPRALWWVARGHWTGRDQLVSGVPSPCRPARGCVGTLSHSAHPTPTSTPWPCLSTASRPSGRCQALARSKRPPLGMDSPQPPQQGRPQLRGPSPVPPCCAPCSLWNVLRGCCCFLPSAPEPEVGGMSRRGAFSSKGVGELLAPCWRGSVGGMRGLRPRFGRQKLQPGACHHLSVPEGLPACVPRSGHRQSGGRLSDT